jgi:hypothetical protein
MIREQFKPLPWRAKGLSDTIDGSTAFNGAMASLQNLIPDPTTAELWQCRPAAVSIATFPGGPFSSGFSAGFMHSTGNIVALKIVGNVAYGLVSLSDGFDHPFALNLLTNAFINITGVVTGPPGSQNIPTSQPSSGAWTPPIMDLIGSKMVVTHSGFSFTAFFIGWFDISTPTAPVWNAGNITGAAGVPFTQPPIGVAQFFNRAYYMVNYVSQPEVIISDPLNPLAASGASGAGTVVPILTFGDNTPLTAFGQLRLFNQLGGIIQALIVFKGTSNIYQITGDLAFASASNPQPAVNAMNFATGTMAPLSLCSTPRGLAFVAPDGLRIIDFSANVSDPIGYDGQGVSAPFIFSGTPSRMCAACNGNVIRISTQNILLPTGGYQEYWYDIERKVWSGPHTFPASVIQPYGNTFIMAGQGVLGQLWRSDVVQSPSSSFVEGGNPLSYSYTTAFLPDTDKLGNIHVSQSLLTCALAATVAPVQINAIDQNGTVIDTVQLAGTGGAANWGQFNWGQAAWGVSTNALNPRKLPWHFPLVFARAQFSVTGQSASPVRLGAFHFRYKQLRYLTDIGAAA